MNNGNGAPKFLVDPYLEWVKTEGIPVHEDFGFDLLTLDVKPWARMDALGAYAHCLGRGDFANMYVCEIPPGKQTAPQQHMFEEVVYVLDGNGSTVVDTVAFACFKKSLWTELGGFDEKLLTNEDYDFNYRVRLAGLDVILDRSGHCDYFARTSFSDLAAQYRRYGGWKARMIRLHPRSIKLRHLVAPAFVLSLVCLMTLSIFWPPFALLLSLEIGLYVLLSLTFGWQIKQRNNDGLGMLLLLPLVFLTIHLTWGTSFLLGLVRQPR